MADELPILSQDEYTPMVKKRALPEFLKPIEEEDEFKIQLSPKEAAILNNADDESSNDELMIDEVT